MNAISKNNISLRPDHFQKLIRRNDPKEHKKDVFLRVTQVADLAGLNRWVKKEPCIVELWFRHDQSSCIRAAKEHFANVSPVQLNREEEQAVVNQALDPSLTQTQVQAMIENVADPDLRKQVRSEVYKGIGVRDEEKAIQSVEREVGIEITDRNNAIWQKGIADESFLKDVPFFSVTVRGKMDGIDRTNMEIVEVKTRQKRTYDHVLLSEKTQVHIYMWMTGMTRCRLLQYFNGKTKTIMIPYDETFLPDMVWPRLATSLGVLHRVLEGDRDVQKQLLSACGVDELHDHLKECL